jgi:hypothetical protein
VVVSAQVQVDMRVVISSMVGKSLDVEEIVRLRLRDLGEGAFGMMRICDSQCYGNESESLLIWFCECNFQISKRFLLWLLNNWECRVGW